MGAREVQFGAKKEHVRVSCPDSSAVLTGVVPGRARLSPTGDAESHYDCPQFACEESEAGRGSGAPGHTAGTSSPAAPSGA